MLCLALKEAQTLRRNKLLLSVKTKSDSARYTSTEGAFLSLIGHQLLPTAYNLGISPLVTARDIFRRVSSPHLRRYAVAMKDLP